MEAEKPEIFEIGLRAWGVMCEFLRLVGCRRVSKPAPAGRRLFLFREGQAPREC